MQPPPPPSQPGELGPAKPPTRLMDFCVLYGQLKCAFNCCCWIRFAGTSAAPDSGSPRMPFPLFRPGSTGSRRESIILYNGLVRTRQPTAQVAGRTQSRHLLMLVITSSHYMSWAFVDSTIKTIKGFAGSSNNKKPKPNP